MVEAPQRGEDNLADLRIQTVCLLLIATVVAAVALFWLKSVMIPFVLALLIALGLAPLVDGQIRWLRFPKWLAVFVTFLLSMGLLLLMVSVVTGAVTQLAANAGAYQERLSQLLHWAADTVPLERFGLSRTAVLQPLSKLPMGTVSGILLGTTNAILDLMSQAMLVTLFLVFLLIGFSGRGDDGPTGIWAEMEARVKGFILTKTLISAVTGILVGLTLQILGIELALAFGFFAFLLNFIPTLGSLISTALPVPIVLMNPEISLTVAVLAIVIPGSVHFLIGNVVEPLVMGDSLELHPVTVLLSLMIWGAIWGIVGMLLATPIMAVLKILSDQNDATRPIARLLAGRRGP
ncbi:MAG: AI-2E family transporter [Candidatus Binatia bacterium]|nr:AI-2E family transporter [Candidatus Binatia bacterium]